jgi:hypothetical protein
MHRFDLCMDHIGKQSIPIGFEIDMRRNCHLLVRTCIPLHDATSADHSEGRCQSAVIHDAEWLGVFFFNK